MTDQEKINEAVKRRVDKSWVGKLKEGVKAYMLKNKKAKEFDTTRTKAVSSRLEGSGLTEKELKRLRGG